ncbi:MAG: caspase family protein [Halioglobus sp.]
MVIVASSVLLCGAAVAGIEFTPDPDTTAVQGGSPAPLTSTAASTTSNSASPAAVVASPINKPKQDGMRMVRDGQDYDALKLQWEKTLGGVRTDGLSDVITRRSDLASVAVGFTSSQSSGRSDAWVVVLDATGRLLWEKSIGGPRNDRANSVVDLPDGSLLVVGSTIAEQTGRAVGLVVKLSSSGDILWRKEMSGQGALELQTVVALGQARVVVAGTDGDDSGYVAELKADGTPAWQQRLSQEGPDIVHALVRMANGEIVVAGERTELFDSDAAVARLSVSGSVVWSKTHGGDDNDVFTDIAVTTGGDIVAVGTTYRGENREQGWLVQLDAGGEIQWEKTFGNGGVDRLTGVTVLNDQSLIVVGKTDTDNDSVPNSWVMRLSQQGSVVKTKALGEDYVDGLQAITARPDGTFAAVGYIQRDFDAQMDGYVALLGTPLSSKKRPVYAAADGPTLFVPGGGTLTTERATVQVLGNVLHDRPVTQLFVDGKQTEILPNGAFVKQVSVPIGRTEITIDAVDDENILGTTTVVIVRTEPGQLQNDGDFTELLASVEFGRYHAVVIGNNDYPADDIPSLRSAVNDAKAVAKILEEDYGFEVDLIKNAKRSDILSVLDKKSRELGAEDNLLLYYAGHGYYDEDVDLGYWLPSDATMESKDAWIRNSSITDSIKAMNAKHVLLVADSCFSGTLLRNVDVKRTGRFYEQMANRSARLVMTSGGIEPVMDEGGDGHSVFARNLLRKLRSSDQIIDGTSLYQAIREPVVMTSEQVPQYSNIRFVDSDGGDFLFVKKTK